MTALVAIVWSCASMLGCGTAPTPPAGSVAATTPIIQDEPTVDRFPMKVGDRWGFIDRSGRVVIHPQYQWAGDFAYGLAPVQVREWTCGYVDEEGRMAIEARFEVAQPFSEGLAVIYQNGRYGYIDTNGTIVLELECERVGDFSEGLTPVKTSEGWGFIDRTGRFVLEPQYGDTIGFREGLAGVEMRKQMGESGSSTERASTSLRGRSWVRRNLGMASRLPGHPSKASLPGSGAMWIEPVSL